MGGKSRRENEENWNNQYYWIHSGFRCYELFREIIISTIPNWWWKLTWEFSAKTAWDAMWLVHVAVPSSNVIWFKENVSRWLLFNGYAFNASRLDWMGIASDRACVLCNVGTESYRACSLSIVSHSIVVCICW